MTKRKSNAKEFKLDTVHLVECGKWFAEVQKSISRIHC